MVDRSPQPFAARFDQHRGCLPAHQCVAFATEKTCQRFQDGGSRSVGTARTLLPNADPPPVGQVVLMMDGNSTLQGARDTSLGITCKARTASLLTNALLSPSALVRDCTASSSRSPFEFESLDAADVAAGSRARHAIARLSSDESACRTCKTDCRASVLSRAIAARSVAVAVSPSLPREPTQPPVFIGISMHKIS